MDNFIYGKRPVAELLKSDSKIISAFTSDPNDPLVLDLKKSGVPIRVLSKTEMDRKFTNALHQGLVVQIAPFVYKDEDWLYSKPVQKNDLVVVLDGIEDPQNLGAIARSAAAAGAAALLIRKDRQALVTPAAIKASAGYLMLLNVVIHTNTAQVLKNLKKSGYWVVGAVAGAKSGYQSYDVDSPLAVVIGNEHSGISRIVQEQLDFPVSIAMASGIDSLNASAAAAVVLMDIYNRRAKSLETK